MIAFIEGTVSEVQSDRVVIQTGGFGVEVLATARALARCQPGAHVRLATHMVIREDAWTLYGFPDASTRLLFGQLLNVSGVGPKLALALLTTLTPAQLALAVSTGDAALLASTPGVGKRTAERLVVELKGKIADALDGEAATLVRSSSPAAEDAVAALLALGFRESNVRTVLGELLGQIPDATAETLIRKALARLR